MKLFGVMALLAILMASVGCSQTPVTFAPYGGYGGSADGLHHGDGGNYWQVGMGASFTLGGTREYVTPVPGSPALPVASQVNVNNSNSNSSNSSSSSSSNSSAVQSQTVTVTACPKCGKMHWPHCN